LLGALRDLVSEPGVLHGSPPVEVVRVRPHRAEHDIAEHPSATLPDRTLHALLLAGALVLVLVVGVLLLFAEDGGLCSLLVLVLPIAALLLGALGLHGAAAERTEPRRIGQEATDLRRREPHPIRDADGVGGEHALTWFASLGVGVASALVAAEVRREP